MINKKVYVTPEFSELLANMRIGLVEYITIYKIEGDNFFFKANRAKLHMTKEELDEVTVSVSE